MIGRITHYNPSRRYGFITVTTQVGAGRVQKQYFFHLSNFVKYEAPVLGAYVVFELGDAIAIGKPMQAVQVRIATEAEAAASGIDAGAEALKSAESKVQGGRQ